ncbi:MAG: hypothetical protein DI598_03935 [Pseudopedobacter saltans]|uniref:Uncharacterized protein n=1 Tax=Pseudopedobacter saltans TaxID=151895 RepID=A0A2W5FA69_9SPHI|nr:MAG: hypothetical protein DI598_03935 [Pseudopedobacter saltans]
MENEFDKKYDMFTRCVLVSLFVGISAVYINLFVDMGFRYFTHYNLSSIINVSSIIMGCVILLMILGVLYYGFRVWFKKLANPLFSIAMIALTAFCAWKVTGVVRSPIYRETVQFRELLIGILSINGVLAAIFIPMLYSKDKLISQII